IARSPPHAGPDEPGGSRVPATLVGPGLAGPRDAAPSADARGARPLADAAEDTIEPEDLRQAPARRLHDREGCARNHARVHAQRQSLPPRGQDGESPRVTLPARTLGGWPGQYRCSAAV